MGSGTEYTEDYHDEKLPPKDKPYAGVPGYKKTEGLTGEANGTQTKDNMNEKKGMNQPGA